MSDVQEFASIADLVGLLTSYLTLFASHLPTIFFIFAFIFFFPIRSELDGNPLLDFVPIVLVPLMYLFRVQPALGFGLIGLVLLAVVFVLDIASELNVSAWWVTYYLIAQAALGWFTSYGWYGLLGAICLVRYLNHGAWGLARLVQDGIGCLIVMRLTYSGLEAHTRQHGYRRGRGVVSAIVSQILALDWDPDFDGFNASVNALVLRWGKATVTVAQSLTGKLRAFLQPPPPPPRARQPRSKVIPPTEAELAKIRESVVTYDEVEEERAEVKERLKHPYEGRIERMVERMRRNEEKRQIEARERAKQMELRRLEEWQEKRERKEEGTHDTPRPATRGSARGRVSSFLLAPTAAPPPPFLTAVLAPVSAPVPVPISTPVSAPVPEPVPEVVYPVISQVPEQPELASMVVGPIDTPVDESHSVVSKTLDGRVAKPVHKATWVPSLSALMPSFLTNELDRILPTSFGNGAPVIGYLPGPMEGLQSTPAQIDLQDLTPGPMLIDEPEPVRQTRYGVQCMSIQSEDDMDIDAPKSAPSAGLRLPPRYGFRAIVQQAKQTGWQPTAKMGPMPQGPQQMEASSNTKPEGFNSGFAGFKPQGQFWAGPTSWTAQLQTSFKPQVQQQQQQPVLPTQQQDTQASSSTTTKPWTMQLQTHTKPVQKQPQQQQKPVLQKQQQAKTQPPASPKPQTKQPQTPTKPKAKPQQQQPQLQKGKQVQGPSLTWPKPEEQQKVQGPSLTWPKPQDQQETSVVAQKALEMMTQLMPAPKTPLPSQKAWPTAQLTPTEVMDQPAIPGPSTQAAPRTPPRLRTPESPMYPREATSSPKTPEGRREYSTIPEMRVEGGGVVPATPQATTESSDNLLEDDIVGDDLFGDNLLELNTEETGETSDAAAIAARRILKPRGRLSPKKPTVAPPPPPPPPPPRSPTPPTPSPGPSKPKKKGLNVSMVERGAGPLIEVNTEDEYEDQVASLISQGFDDDVARTLVTMVHPSKK
ncbi:hypothetical protein F4776DRAFT_672030 [Hypoxylon sp. NC0597]|nr:hypothetical protein F4776DRAFT_672030 [Hypoxylon sp. NC0597]